MKAAALLLMSVGLVVFIQDAEGLNKEQEWKLRVWFDNVKDVIQQSRLVEILKGCGFKQGDETKILKFVKDMDPNNSGIDLDKLKKIVEMTRCINMEYHGGSAETFFAIEKDAISKTAFMKWLVGTGKCTEDQAKTIYAKIHTGGDGTIGCGELFSSKNEAVAVHITTFF